LIKNQKFDFKAEKSKVSNHANEAGA